MTDTPPPPPSDLPASWQEEHDDAIRTDRRSRVWWVVGAIVLVVLAGAGIFAFIQALDPDERAWPDAYGGRPAGLGADGETAAEVTPEAAPGVYIWQSFDGWHLWLVNGEGLAGLTGSITSSADLNSAVSSGPDSGTVSVDGRTITFDLSADAAVAGVDFDPGFGDQLTFDLETADGPVEASEVFTGSKPTPVEAVPVVLDKPLVD